jgi:raffinose/stachyose/melibiose transport system permease protein
LPLFAAGKETEMESNKKTGRVIASIVLAVICVFYVYPIFAIFINSLKMNKAITTSGVFQLPTA